MDQLSSYQREKRMKFLCKICFNEGWVCEEHPLIKWNYGEPGCCGGAGAPCKCNLESPPWTHTENNG